MLKNGPTNSSVPSISVREIKLSRGRINGSIFLHYVEAWCLKGGSSAALTLVKPWANLLLATETSAVPLRRECCHSRRQRLNFCTSPPRSLVAVPVQLAMMNATQRYGELITDLAAERPRLSKTQMVGIGRRTTAHQARLCGNKLAVVAVTQANGLCRYAATADAGLF
jgi:hypothetical protein